MTRRALLLSGGVNQSLNHANYHNDLVRWSKELVQRRISCQVCFANGSYTLGLPAKIGKKVPVSGTAIQQVQAGLDWLLGSPADLALLLVSNHGDQGGKISLWGKAQANLTLLQGALNKSLVEKHVLIFGQCYSGYFTALASNKTVVYTACKDDQLSHSCPPLANVRQSEFLFQLANALFGPEGGKAPASPPTLAAAFTTAAQANRWTPRAQPTIVDPEEPQQSDPGNLGVTLVL